MSFVRLYVISAMLSVASLSSARADNLFLSGASFGANSHYVFAGSVVTVGDNPLGSGFSVRLWADYLGYEYNAGATQIEASAWSGTISGAYQYSGNWGWVNLAGGVQVRDTELTPDDLGNRARGLKTYPILGIDGGLNLDEFWRVSGDASYTIDLEAYRANAQLSRALGERFRFGIGGTYQGDPTYVEKKLSLTAGVNLSQNLELNLDAGHSWASSGKGFSGGLSLVLVTH